MSCERSRNHADPFNGFGNVISRHPAHGGLAPYALDGMQGRYNLNFLASNSRALAVS